MMEDLGEAKICLGLEIISDRSARTLYLSQTQYTNFIQERFGMQDCRPVPTPMLRFNSKDESLEIVKNNDPATCVPYCPAIGALMYLMLGTRLDIAFAVDKLSRYCANPQQKHWVAVKRIFRYLAGTKDSGLVYRGDASADLIGFRDSDRVGDLGDRQSTSGNIFSSAASAVNWCSRKQTIVAAFSCEAEYMGLSATCKESI